MTDKTVLHASVLLGRENLGLQDALTWWCQIWLNAIKQMVSSIVAFKGVVHFYWLLTCICSKRSSAWFWEDKRNLLTDSRKCLIWFLVLRQSSMEFGKQMRSLSLTQDHTFHPQSGCVEFNQRKKWSPCSIIFPINFKQRLYRLCVCISHLLFDSLFINFQHNSRPPCPGPTNWRWRFRPCFWWPGHRKKDRKKPGSFTGQG